MNGGRYGHGRKRRFMDDPIYSIEHLERCPEQYERVEHRLKMADRDWAEFCGYSPCSAVHTLVEMFRDTERGIDLSDKGVTVTRQLARGVNARAYVMAYWVDRPREVQREIDRLNARVLELTRQFPIKRYRAQLIEPHRGRTETYTPEQWWSLVALWHSEHWEHCEIAQRSSERHANPAWLRRAQGWHTKSGLYVPPQQTLEIP